MQKEFGILLSRSSEPEATTGAAAKSSERKHGTGSTHHESDKAEQEKFSRFDFD